MDKSTNNSTGLIDSVYIQGKREGTITGFIVGVISALLAGLTLFNLLNNKKEA